MKKFNDMDIGGVDGDYRGEVGVVLLNHSTKYIIVKAGDCVTQLILEQIKTLVVQNVMVLDDTNRGVGDFGSAGVQSQSHSIHRSKVAKEREVLSPKPEL